MRIIRGFTYSVNNQITIFYNGFNAYSGNANDAFGVLYRILFKDSEATEACADYLDSIGYGVNVNARDVAMMLSRVIQSYVSDYGSNLDDVIYWDHGSLEFSPYMTSIRSSKKINCAADSDGYGADAQKDAEYLKKLADGVVKAYEDYWSINNLVYEISDAAITFIDGDVVLYIQPLENIKPDMNDLDSDIEELADEVIGTSIPKF